MTILQYIVLNWGKYRFKMTNFSRRSLIYHYGLQTAIPSYNIKKHKFTLLFYEHTVHKSEKIRASPGYNSLQYSDVEVGRGRKVKHLH